MTRTDRRPAHDALRLDTIGRTTFRGIAWAVYSDGAYQHAVRATHYDRQIEAPADDEARAEAYDHWCRPGAAFADDSTARKVARKLGLDGIHSADGTGARLSREAMPDPYRTTWHRDGSLTYWDVHTRGWCRQEAADLGDATLATMSQADRARVIRIRDGR